MPVVQTTVLRLVFGTDVPGKTTAMEFNSPRADITEAQIRAVMQLFIDSQLVSSTNGGLASIDSADIVTRSVDSLLS
ncbi:MAG: DUF2922 domain-containing protein [Caldisericota bacterium]|jgi:hypothetical protein|nr:DUF2922 domain-containing protein [Caldisericota bacterium]